MFQNLHCLDTLFVYNVDACGMIYSYFKKGCWKKCTRQPERYCGWLWGHCSSKKFERMVREATNICMQVLKESNKSRFDSFSRYEQCIDHIPYYLSGLSRAHFVDNLSRNSSIQWQEEGCLLFRIIWFISKFYGGEKIIITSIAPHMACMYFYGWFLINEVNCKLLIYLQWWK